MSHGGGLATSFARCKNGTTFATRCLIGSRCMARVSNATNFSQSKLAGALFTRSSEKCFNISSRENSSVLSSSDQPKQQQIIQQRVRQIADLLVEIDDHGIERLGGNRHSQSPRDRCPCSISCAKSRFFRYLSSFRLLSLVLLPGSATYGKCANAGTS